MRNGIEIVTITYDNNKITRLKNRGPYPVPSYEYIADKYTEMTIEKKIDILLSMFYSNECHVSVFTDARVYRYYIFH